MGKPPSRNPRPYHCISIGVEDFHKLRTLRDKLQAKFGFRLSLADTFRYLLNEYVPKGETSDAD